MDAEQQDRLAKLAARGRASQASSVPPPPPPPPPPSPPAGAAPPGLLAPPDPRTRIDAAPGGVPSARSSRRAAGLAAARRGSMPDGIAPRTGRRKHTALAGRIVAAGMSTSAFLGGLAALASAPPPAWQRNAVTDPGTDAATAGTETAASEDTEPTTAEPPVQDTIYVVQQVPRVIYVDENGNPVDPAAAAAAAAPAAADDEAPADDAPTTRAPKAARPTAAGGGGTVAPAAESPTPTAVPTPAAATAPPTPTPTPAPTQATTATTAPRPTTTPPTTKPCTGSKCP